MLMCVLQWNSIKGDGLPKKTGRYLCCYVVKGSTELFYNVFEFNKDAQEFQFGYVGVVVTHWAEVPPVKKAHVVADMVKQEEDIQHAE